MHTELTETILVLSTKQRKLKKLDFVPMREKDNHFIGIL